MAGQLSVVAALVLANGFFVASEFALVSLRRTRIDQLAAEGNAAAVVVQRAVRDLDRYIAATQVGITVASLMLGGIGEKTFHHLFEPLLLMAGMPKEAGPITASALALGLSYFIMTALHVIVGELMPKSIALQQPENISLLIGRPMMLAARLFTPLVWVLNGTGNFLLRRMGLHASEGHAQVHSPEELDLLFAQSHDAGELTKTEFEILHRVVRFSDLTAREVMVPRVEMSALPLTMTRAQLQAYLQDQPHTRVPVFRNTNDDIVGVAHLKDLVRLAAATPAEESGNESINLMKIVREAARVPETITIDRLLVEFKRRRQQMAVVIDEYGGTSGLVTMGDLLQQAFGDVHDEFDRPEPEVTPQPDGSIRVNGRVRIDEINEVYGTGFSTEEADTVAGLVMDALGRVAAPGDEVVIGGVRLQVEAVDRQRILSLLMWPVKERLSDQKGPLPPASGSSSDGVTTSH
jgi:CBS domain containing-hemolysin-like protein